VGGKPIGAWAFPVVGKRKVYDHTHIAWGGVRSFGFSERFVHGGEMLGSKAGSFEGVETGGTGKECYVTSLRELLSIRTK